jgi:hypothetical protein
MKNVQVIDGAENCTYPIYSFTDDEFKTIFPGEGQDIEFIKDVSKRIGEKAMIQTLKGPWSRGEMNKEEVQGIHGTLFYQLEEKKKYYPTKKEIEMVTHTGKPYYRVVPK